MSSGRRNCQEVIEQMLALIPADCTGLIKSLESDFNYAKYRAPEETSQWDKVYLSLRNYIPTPIADWQFEVLSVFTTRSVNDLKLDLL